MRTRQSNIDLEGDDAEQNHSRKFEYIKRMLHFKQIDWEFAIAQVIFLCVNPKQVYQFADYRKQTKDTLARDDPGFLILLIGIMTITRLGYCIALQIPVLSGKFYICLVCPTLIFFISGAILAYGMHIIFSNQNMFHMFRGYGLTSSRRNNEIDWRYCFDVHSNSVLPAFLICNVLQYILLPLLLVLTPPFISALISNSLYSVAICYYFYVSTLGYSRLEVISKDTVIFLTPTVFVIVIMLLLTLFGVNMTKIHLSLMRA